MGYGNLLNDSNTKDNSMLIREWAYSTKSFLNLFHHMVYPGISWSACTVCQGTSVLVGQQLGWGLLSAFFLWHHAQQSANSTYHCSNMKGECCSLSWVPLEASRCYWLLEIYFNLIQVKENNTSVARGVQVPVITINIITLILHGFESGFRNRVESTCNRRSCYTLCLINYTFRANFICFIDPNNRTVTL